MAGEGTLAIGFSSRAGSGARELYVSLAHGAHGALSWTKPSSVRAWWYPRARIWAVCRERHIRTAHSWLGCAGGVNAICSGVCTTRLMALLTIAASVASTQHHNCLLYTSDAADDL